MPDFTIASAWSALFLGLFALFAGIGELRQRGHWQKMLEEISASPSLQIVTALVELFLGAVIYLVNPWTSPDWLSKAMSLLGGLMCLEALVILAFSDLYIAFWLRRIGPLERFWAWVSIVFGMVLIALAIPRF